MKFKNNSGVSLMTVIITIVAMIILASVTINYSLKMMDDADKAQNEATIYTDRETIRALLTNAMVDKNARVGFALNDDIVIVIGPDGTEYGTDYYLVPGGEDDGDLGKIKFEFGDDTLTAYKNLSAPYVVDYYTGEYERVENIRFK